MEIIFFGLGMLAGVIIAYFAVGLYYERTGRYLRNQVNKLRELNFRMLWKMEEAGLIKWERNSQGKIVGLDLH